MALRRAVTSGFAGRAVELATTAARELGIDPAGAAILRQAAAVTVSFARAGVVARVERPGALAAARRQVLAARVLERRAVPAARLVAPDRQPLERRDGIVTLWRRLRILPGTPGPRRLGALARRLHQACSDVLPAEAPPLDPFEPLPRWLRRPARTPEPPGVDALWERLADLRDRWQEAAADDPLGTTLVHGDFHSDNVVLTEEGPVMLDLETAGRGPASWDLLTQELAVRRYGGPAARYRRFCAAYGAELPSSPSVAVLRQAQELHLVCWAVGHRDLSPALAEQAAVRLASFLGDGGEPWTLI